MPPWPAIRASLIALAILVGLLDGCPVPPADRTVPWARPIVQRVEEVRRVLLRPVRWIGADLALTQRWSLFTGASRKRFRLYVEGRAADGTWQLLYRAGDPAHAAYGDQLAYRRMRGMYSPRGQSPRSQHRAFAMWMAHRVLADHPEYSAARTRLERIELATGEVRPTGEFTLEYVVSR